MDGLICSRDWRTVMDHGGPNTAPTAPPRLYSAGEAAALLGVSRRRINHIARHYRIGVMVGHQRAFQVSDLPTLRVHTPRANHRGVDSARP